MEFQDERASLFYPVTGKLLYKEPRLFQIIFLFVEQFKPFTFDQLEGGSKFGRY